MTAIAPTPQLILDLFRKGRDTTDIAKRFWVDEAEVERLLHRAIENERDERRIAREEGREWRAGQPAW
jgi:hypothetical protein